MIEEILYVSRKIMNKMVGILNDLMTKAYPYINYKEKLLDKELEKDRELVSTMNNLLIERDHNRCWDEGD